MGDGPQAILLARNIRPPAPLLMLLSHVVARAGRRRQRRGYHSGPAWWPPFSGSAPGPGIIKFGHDFTPLKLEKLLNKRTTLGSGGEELETEDRQLP